MVSTPGRTSAASRERTSAKRRPASAIAPISADVFKLAINLPEHLVRRGSAINFIHAIPPFPYHRKNRLRAALVLLEPNPNRFWIIQQAAVKRSAADRTIFRILRRIKRGEERCAAHPAYQAPGVSPERSRRRDLHHKKEDVFPAVEFREDRNKAFCLENRPRRTTERDAPAGFGDSPGPLGRLAQHKTRREKLPCLKKTALSPDERLSLAPRVIENGLEKLPGVKMDKMQFAREQIRLGALARPGRAVEDDGDLVHTR